LVEHSHNTGHCICVEDAKIIARMDHYGKIKIRESMEIELNENNLNRYEGIKLSKKWKHVLQKIKITIITLITIWSAEIFGYGYYY
jgi:hypothetical protein